VEVGAVVMKLGRYMGDDLRSLFGVSSLSFIFVCFSSFLCLKKNDRDTSLVVEEERK
jgi:hypothetical protein